ncbi:3-oxoadipate enol-lactonase 2 [Maioricimonas rarisocia]|uniref:3-oxoadipate enol-lactonase 2 n=1 Tax=Maioricimonas rarisocia TaxID=2528026 RepID=A0A517Z0E7_9PLAN|nr:alpha/beta fold hydrolase [Maioricimonas rarisocia]QDU35948.1 3-oxoadipate enol-lactonase 2 [Maioricimonas rarisocia]
MPVVRANGIDQHVLVQGEGPAILFVHGFPLDHTMWRWQYGRFTRSHRVIAPDLRGFGKTPPGDAPASMELYADDLAALLDELNIAEPVVLCGLSMGGYVAWQFIRRHGHRLAGLVLCDTRAAADTPEIKETRGQLAEHVLASGTATLAESIPEKLFSEVTREKQPQLLEETKRVILKTPPEGVAAAARAMAARPDMNDLLPAIDVPTLVVVGADDRLSPPAEMRQLAAAIPAAEFVEIDNAGHMTPLEASAKFNLVMQQFLDQVPAR